jgi:hypothetical protein
MGRVFTVSFHFREQPCTALVCLKNAHDYNPAFKVHYLSKEVESVLPERQIVFSLANGIETPARINRLTEELVEKTSEAITHYLEEHT